MDNYRKELKQQEREADQLSIRLQALDNELRNLKRERNKVDLERKEILRNLALEKRKETYPVTDHAIVRYVERVRGIDIDEIIAELRDPGLMELIGQLTDGTFPHPNGKYRVVVTKGKIVTVIENQP